MAKQVENEVIYYYYDTHPTEEDLMGETVWHALLVEYLVNVLMWLFHDQDGAIYDNLNFYRTDYRKEHPLIPDIAVMKGIPFRKVRSWRLGKTGPAPHVVFEVASEETWTRDRREKPLSYAQIGVQEYYAYDPNAFPLDRESGRRLFGWHLDPSRGLMRELPLTPEGSLWSPHLQSWLIPDGEYLRLYDSTGHLRLTQLEFEAEARREEALLVEAEARRADAEARRADAEARRAEALAEKLRSLGIDPNQL